MPKIYKVDYWDYGYNLGWEEDLTTLGFFSSLERANQAGEHVCQKANEVNRIVPQLPDDTGYNPDYRYKCREYDLDEYYYENLTPLSETIKEEE